MPQLEGVRRKTFKSQSNMDHPSEDWDSVIVKTEESNSVTDKIGNSDSVFHHDRGFRLFIVDAKYSDSVYWQDWRVRFSYWQDWEFGFNLPPRLMIQMQFIVKTEDSFIDKVEYSDLVNRLDWEFGSR